MKKSSALLGGVAIVVFMSSSALAGVFQDTVNECVNKYANTRDSMTVMLKCKAADGKLSDCSVLDAPTPTKGFDKAAMCIAAALPIGSKTGEIKVPIRFAGNV